MKTATCTWGEGPDVLLSFNGDRFILYEDPKHDKAPRGDYRHGHVTNGSMDLTAEEAEELGMQLIHAAREARELQRTAIAMNM